MAGTKKPKFRVHKPLRFSHHPRPGYAVRGMIWLEKDGELYIGGGRLMLLECIEKLGSIAAAARYMKLGYRNAWLWVEAMNRLAPSPLVEKSSGGASGGYTRLTEEGQKVLSEYRELNDKFREWLMESK